MSFRHVLEDIGWEYVILKKSKEIVIQDNINTNENLMKENSLSPSYDNKCIECDKLYLSNIIDDDNSDSVILLKCGHTLH